MHAVADVALAIIVIVTVVALSTRWRSLTLAGVERYKIWRMKMRRRWFFHRPHSHSFIVPTTLSKDRS